MIETIEEVSKVLYPVFFWIGVVFAVFSAVLFSVFIANSIIQKKREIGVLRAIGARGLDVYRIFLCETGVIAFVNALLAILFSWLITGAINKLVQGDVLHNVILVHFGIGPADPGDRIRRRNRGDVHPDLADCETQADRCDPGSIGGRNICWKPRA